MALYDDLKEMITRKFYTVLEAQSVLNAYFKFLQLSADQYEELMELSKNLNPNTEDDEEAIWKTQLENRVTALETNLSLLKDAVENGSKDVAEPATQAGTKEDPITAAKGLHYEKDKYYEDPEKDYEVYLCTTTVDLNGLPHDFVNVYFNWFSKAVGDHAQATA